MTEFEKALRKGAERYRNASQEEIDLRIKNANSRMDNDIDSWDVSDNKQSMQSQGNQIAGKMVQEAGGGNPLADGLAAGVSTGNPLVGVGMGVISGLQGAAKEKQRKRQIESDALMEQAQNEQSTQMRRSAAIQSLAANLSNSLLS